MKSNSVPVAVRVAAVLLAAACCAPLAHAADSNPPDRMTYQGFVVDGNGVALGNTAPKNYDVIFRIYSDQSGGTRLWSEQQTITVDKGYFSALLGEGSQYSTEARPPISSVFTNVDASDRYVEITVKGIGAGGSDATILPRLRLLTSPYAFLARHAVNANYAASLVNSGNGQVVTVSGGNVGINKAGPSSALDVNGTVTGTGLSVTGPATLNSLAVQNNASVAGTITAGAATVSGATSTKLLSVTTSINTATLSASGTVSADKFVGNGTIPVGGIIMWSGTTPPAGWALCDGGTYNGQITPDLRGRFVLGLGAGTNLTARTLSQRGGEEAHVLSVNEMPAHRHTLTLANNGYPDGSGDRTPNYYLMHPSAGADYGYTSSEAGLGYAHNNMPPFHVLAYIMRVQ
jgi:microcystin-dependent protein